jgi:hypothetical protein
VTGLLLLNVTSNGGCAKACASEKSPDIEHGLGQRDFSVDCSLEQSNKI